MYLCYSDFFWGVGVFETDILIRRHMKKTIQHL